MQIPALAPAQKVAIAGAVLALVGAALPWVTSGAESITGIDVDGFVTTMAGLSVLGVTTLWEWRRLQMGSVALLGAIIAATAATYVFTLGDVSDTTGAAIAPGAGVYLTVVAGVLVGGSGIYALVERRRAIGRSSANAAAPDETDGE